MNNTAETAARGAVFVQTNEADANRVLAFARDADGWLSRWDEQRTGGRGDGVPHLASQGSVTLTGDGDHLLVTNTGSGDLSAFAVRDRLELVGVVPTHGAAPKSVAEHRGLVYVLNAGDPSVVAFQLANGSLELVRGSHRDLRAEADPAQVGLSPDGSYVVVTERGTNALALYPVQPDGTLGEPSVIASSGPTPYGFAFAGDRVLVATEAFGAAKGKAAASSYRIAEDTLEPVSRSIGNGRSEICWAVATSDGRYVFTTNFADGAVSRYAVGEDGSLSLEDAAAGIATDGQPGLRDEALSGDGLFLYAIDADLRRIVGWSVRDASLSPLGSWDGLPDTAAGLAAR
jgi:6-phosphogluconolactonase